MAVDAQARGRWALLVAVAMVTVLAGCWFQPGGAPGNTRFNGIDGGLTTANVASLHEAWSVDVAGGGTGATTEPIVSGNRVYVTHTKWAAIDVIETLAVEARDIGTGDLVWQTSLVPPGYADWAQATQVTLIDGALWVATQTLGTPTCTSTLTRLDPATGAVLTEETTDGFGSYPVGDGGIVAHAGCLDTMARSLVVRDAATRAVVWTATFPALAPVSEPTIADGRIYVVAGASLYAFAAQGCGGASTCAPLWQADGATGRPVAGPGGRVLVLHDEAGNGAEVFVASVRAYDGATGDLLWQTATGDPTRSTAIDGIAVGGDRVYVPVIHDPWGAPGPSTELAVYPASGCGASTCDPSWTASLGPGAAFRPTVGGGVAYVTLHVDGGRSSAVVAAPAAGCGGPTCTELVRRTRPGWMTSPSLAAGRLFVSAESDLVAFAP